MQDAAIINDQSSLLTRSWRGPLSYRNQSIDLHCKSMDCFLCDNEPRHERVKKILLRKIRKYDVFLVIFREKMGNE